MSGMDKQDVSEEKMACGATFKPLYNYLFTCHLEAGHDGDHHGQYGVGWKEGARYIDLYGPDDCTCVAFGEGCGTCIEAIGQDFGTVCPDCPHHWEALSRREIGW